MDEYNLNNNNVDVPNDEPSKVDFRQIAKDILPYLKNLFFVQETIY